ncbi:MAG: hypothetical protein P4M13_09880 [Alphaproteobacteria bacterium]|nr:hypothetical protein [Alphaproteobacteria bacterium]
MFKRRVALAVLLLTLGGCTTAVESNPPRTATEELLISTAAERAADSLVLKIPPNTPVFVDGSHFEGTDSKYAMGAIRTGLLKQQLRLVDDRKKARVVIEARSGALSTDRKTFLIGVPEFTIPIPFSTTPFTFPQIALYGSEEQKGVAKFALTAYDAQQGNLVEALDPRYGFSHNTKKTVLIFYSWTDMDALPSKDEETPAETPDEAAPESNAGK